MNEYLGLDNLMGFFGLDKNPFFAQYYNEILSVNENQELDIRGSQWGEVQPVFTYEMYEQYNDVEVMATFVDLDSDPLPMGGSVKVKKMTGSIPRHKALITLNEVDYREKLKDLYAMRTSATLMGNDPAAAVRNSLEKYFYTKMASIPNAHKNTLNFMIGQLKSRLDFTLNDANNPQGIKGITFPSHVPAKNRIVSKFMSKDDTTGAVTYVEGADPANYFKKLVDGIHNNDNAAMRYENVVFEMSRKTFVDIMGHPAWAKHVAYLLQPQFYLVANNDSNAIAYGKAVLNDKNDAGLVDIFKRVTGASEVLLNKAVVSAERVVKLTDSAPSLVRPLMDAFDYGKILVRPAGDFIKIIPVAPMRGDQSAIVASMYEGRGIIEYWYDKREKVQTWRSEMTCMPVFMMPSRIYSIDVNGSAVAATPTSLTYTSAAESKTVTVTGESPVSATTDSTWLSVNGISGKTVTVKAKANNGTEARSGNVVVTDRNGDSVTVAVTQAAPAKPEEEGGN